MDLLPSLVTVPLICNADITRGEIHNRVTRSIILVFKLLYDGVRIGPQNGPSVMIIWNMIPPRTKEALYARFAEDKNLCIDYLTSRVLHISKQLLQNEYFLKSPSQISQTTDLDKKYAEILLDRRIRLICAVFV